MNIFPVYDHRGMKLIAYLTPGHVEPERFCDELFRNIGHDVEDPVEDVKYMKAARNDDIDRPWTLYTSKIVPKKAVDVSVVYVT